MKITLDTRDVKDAVEEYLASSGVIASGASLDWDIQPVRTGDEKIRIEVTIITSGKNGGNKAFNPDEPEIDEKTEVDDVPQKGLFE